MRQFTNFFLITTIFLSACTVTASQETTATQIAEPNPTPEATPTTFPTPQPEIARPDSCPITQPQSPEFVPPEPYAEKGPNGEFWYGSTDLWTLLWPDGTWQDLPKSEAGFGNKVVWFREGYVWTEEPEPELTMSARQLDGTAIVEPFMHATNGYHPDYESFILTGIELPAWGCWEITGEYSGHILSFVVWVAP